MSQVVPSGANEDSADGNTKRQNPRKTWVFTHWLNGCQPEEVACIFENAFQDKEFKADYYFSLEYGEDKKPHFQGFFRLEWKKRLTQLKNICETTHWEGMKGTFKRNFQYCMKECPEKWWTNLVLPKRLKWPEWYDWQREILTIMEGEPDDRTIYWVWDATGSRGKTTLMKYMISVKKAVGVVNKSNDALHLAAKHLEKEGTIHTVVYNITRSQEGRINYGLIEQLKDGLILSGKYEGCMEIIACPHVFIFANWEPDYDKMSLDRWKVIDLASWQPGAFGLEITK